MAGCSTCSSTSYCLTLINNSFYLDSSNFPQRCFNHVPFCYQCTVTAGALSSYVCLSCEDRTVFNGTNNCVECLAAMTYCSDCTSLTYCIDCQVTHYVLPDHSGCGDCTIIDHCYDCNSETQCVTCESPQYYVNSSGGCPPCIDAITNCLNCSVDWSIS